MTDRRRINGPPSGTTPLVYSTSSDDAVAQRPLRSRQQTQPRKIFLRTGLTPSASGSAYLELQQTHPSSATFLLAPASSLKLSCTVHGPKPLPRSAPFSPQLLLSTHIKYTPFASRTNRRAFVRDSGERDLGVHLEAALRGVIIGDRWPKSGVDVTITVLEAEEDAWWGDGAGTGPGFEGKGIGGAGMMNVLAGCITVASAAIIDAGIDCVDTVTGGVAAIVRTHGAGNRTAHGTEVVVDPCPSEHESVVAACAIGYIQTRDEITEIWTRGDVGDELEALLDGAVEAAKATRSVLAAVLKESLEAGYAQDVSREAKKADATVAGDQAEEDKPSFKHKGKGKVSANDVEMSG